MNRHARRLHERVGTRTGQHLAALGRDLVRVRRDRGVRPHHVVDHVRGFRRPGGEHVADVDDRELRLVVPSDDEVLLRRDPGVPGQVDHEPVAELQHIARRRADVRGQAVCPQRLGELLVQELRAHTVGVNGGHRGHAHAADLGHGAEAHELDPGRIAPRRLDLRGKEHRHVAGEQEPRLLPDDDVDGVGGRRHSDRELRLAALARIRRRLMGAADMVLVGMR